MLTKERLQLFEKLRKKMLGISQEEKSALFSKAKNQNNWFTYDSCEKAFLGIEKLLEPKLLSDFMSKYSFQENQNPKEIGLMLSGNIPAVGFHDILCVLLSGNKAAIKLSSMDGVLIHWFLESLERIDQRVSAFISIEEMLKGKDAYIATGSDNSSRYFDYYFGKYPHLIRKNRTSVAILSGEESEKELQKLGEDIFMYFGLGCRNVSKIFVKKEEDVSLLLDALAPFVSIADHHKYFNNYEYNKSIFLVNRDKHLDNGFVLLKESQDLVSPIGVLFYEVYIDESDLAKKLTKIEGKVQCIVGKPQSGKKVIGFGRAQFPEISDFADQVDTMNFLAQLV